MAKPGRKPLPDAERRSEIVQTRATTAERKLWQRAADAKETTLAEQIRLLMNRWAKRVVSPKGSAPSSGGSSTSSSASGTKRPPRKQKKRTND